MVLILRALLLMVVCFGLVLPAEARPPRQGEHNRGQGWGDACRQAGVDMNSCCSGKASACADSCRGNPNNACGASCQSCQEGCNHSYNSCRAAKTAPGSRGQTRAPAPPLSATPKP